MTHGRASSTRKRDARVVSSSSIRMEERICIGGRLSPKPGCRVKGGEVVVRTKASDGGRRAMGIYAACSRMIKRNTVAVR